MTVLSDRGILQAWEDNLIIQPLREAQIQPASYDLRLGYSFIRRRLGLFSYLTLKTTPFWLWPWEFLLATTEEYLELGDDLAGLVSGRSSVGRLAIQIENAGWVDPGFRGELTLEILNHSWRPRKLTPGMRIAQISFHTLDQPAERPYGHPERHSKYQWQRGATDSLLALDEELTHA